MIGLAVLSDSMDEIMKMYGGFFLYSNPLGSYEQSKFSQLVAILKIARMQNKLCDVTKCLTTVAAGVLSGRDRKKLETGLLFEVLLLDQQISFGVRLFFVTRCPNVPLVTCQKAQT